MLRPNNGPKMQIRGFKNSLKFGCFFGGVLPPSPDATDATHFPLEAPSNNTALIFTMGDGLMTWKAAGMYFYTTSSNLHLNS